MGNRSVYALNSALSTWKDIFELLHLSEKDILRLFDEFTTLPVANLKQLILPISTVQEALYKSETQFPQAVFSMFDCDATKNINFGEYVCFLWSLCTLPESEYSNFILEIYDENGGGELSSGLVRQLVHDLYGDRKRHLTGIQKRIAAIPGGFFTDVTFAKLCRQYPALLTPLTQLRQHLRDTVFGEAFWERLSERRQTHKLDIRTTKLRFMLLRCRHNLAKRSLSAKLLSPLSQKKSVRIFPEHSKMFSDTTTDNSTSFSLSQ